MSAQNLNARLTPLFESLKHTQQLTSRLSKLSTQPGSSPANPEEGDARVELSAEIHQSLKEQEEDFELLRQEVEDQTNSSGWSSSATRRDSGRDREKTDLASQITRLGEDLKMYDDDIRIPGGLQLIHVVTALGFNSARLNCKQNATLKPPSERRESSYSQAFRKATLLATVVEKVRRSCRNRRFWSMLPVT